MIRALIFMTKLAFGDFAMYCMFYLAKALISNSIFKICFRERAKGKITAQTVQSLDFTWYFTIKTSIFKPRPLCRFLCLTNSFYRRCVLCMYNISNLYPVCPIYSIRSFIRSYILHLFLSYFPCWISSANRMLTQRQCKPAKTSLRSRKVPHLGWKQKIDLRYMCLTKSNYLWLQ